MISITSVPTRINKLFAIMLNTKYETIRTSAFLFSLFVFEQVVLELYAEGVRKLLCNCFAHFLVRIEDELDFSVAAVIYDEIVSVGFRTCVCMHCCVGGNVVFSAG